eukprot:g1290.t1
MEELKPAVAGFVIHSPLRPLEAVPDLSAEREDSALLKTPPKHAMHVPLTPSKHAHIAESDLTDNPLRTPPSHQTPVPHSPSKHDHPDDNSRPRRTPCTEKRELEEDADSSSISSHLLSSPAKDHNPNHLANPKSTTFVIHSPLKSKTASQANLPFNISLQGKPMGYVATGKENSPPLRRQQQLHQHTPNKHGGMDDENMLRTPRKHSTPIPASPSKTEHIPEQDLDDDPTASPEPHGSVQPGRPHKPTPRCASCLGRHALASLPTHKREWARSYGQSTWSHHGHHADAVQFTSIRQDPVLELNSTGGHCVWSIPASDFWRAATFDYTGPGHLSEDAARRMRRIKSKRSDQSRKKHSEVPHTESEILYSAESPWR